MAAKYEKMTYPHPSHLYYHNKLYCCMSDHSPPTCKSMECLGYESQRWVVVYLSTCQHYQHISCFPSAGDIFSSRRALSFFEQAFLPLVCLVAFPALPSSIAPNCASISVSLSVHLKDCLPTFSLAFLKG